MRPVLLLFASLPLCAQAPPDGETILKRMAENLASSLDVRRHYVYHQTVRGRLIRSNGQAAREELRQYSAAPGPDRTAKSLLSLDGQYHKNKKETIHYSAPGFKTGGMDFDGDIMEDLISDLVDDKKSRDGIPHNLFPIDRDTLHFYHFTYLDTETAKGRKAYRVAFDPVKKTSCVEIGPDEGRDCPTPWKGEALVDAEEFQPVEIHTALDFKMPWGVKVFLGTDLEQTGFAVSYARVAPNVWFPVSYGTEFRLKVFFGYKRTITLSLTSEDFRRTDVTSEVQFGEPQRPPE